MDKVPGLLDYLVGSYTYYLPFVLFMIWAPIALMDISKREDSGSGVSYAWIFAVLLIPIFGGGLYLILGKSELRKEFRYGLVLGGVGVFLFFWGLSIVLKV